MASHKSKVLYIYITYDHPFLIQVLPTCKHSLSMIAAQLYKSLDYYVNILDVRNSFAHFQQLSAANQHILARENKNLGTKLKSKTFIKTICGINDNRKLFFANRYSESLPQSKRFLNPGNPRSN